jgi:tetratricopeptide (TPR) repeat protein
MAQHFILCDMGRLPEAIQMIQQPETENPEDHDFFLHPCLIQTRILRHIGRNQEALQLLRRGVADGRQRIWTDNGKAYNLVLYFLFAELAATWGQVGQPEKALEDAQQAAAACREDVNEDEVDEQKCTLVHSLTTLSNCFAAVQRNNEALVISHEAVLIYTQNAAQMWDGFICPLRKQELGANAFHSLSLQLTTAGELNKAIVNAEKATELYRELVTLAPRHLPTLASSLQNLALILWNVGHRERAIVTCEEAVGIMQKVVEIEAYFLPALVNALDQLAGYFTKKGDIIGASAANTKSTEARRTYTSLPPRLDFLFEKIGKQSDNEDDEEEGAWETASEGDDEYYNVPMNTDMVISNATYSENLVSAYMDNTLTSSFAALEEPEGPATTDTALVAKGSLTEILSKPLEVRMSMNMSMSMRGTPMDILWWMLVGILLVAVWRRIV